MEIWQVAVKKNGEAMKIAGVIGLFDAKAQRRKERHFESNNQDLPTCLHPFFIGAGYPRTFSLRTRTDLQNQGFHKKH
jgi:hypothetical protein